tara:strand:- start:501 stop:713 length:213 start_codon:yes stop_codon:yes gene_type:complete
MHTTKIKNFSDKPVPFASLRIELGKDTEDRHISTSMSGQGSEVTLFFHSVEEITEFATALMIQSAKALTE